MRLVRCNINNFGRLSDVSLEFKEGWNLLCRENGWGKSSLAVFICAMFYGLGNDKKHGEIDNERKHYLPWQGGTFGGSLTFADETGTYTIYRRFGSKAKEDTFELRDAQTNRISEAYSEKIGEELFQIDRESFLRTAFLFQNQSESGATSSISAKIHNLAENTGDMNNYDQVNKRLLGELVALGESRSTGALARLKSRERTLKGELWQAASVDAELETLQEQYREYERELEEAQAQQEQLLILQEAQEYTRAAAEAAERNAEIEQTETTYPNGIPTIRELDRLNRLWNSICGLRNQREVSSFSHSDLVELEALDNQFKNGAPTDIEIAEQKDHLDRIHELELQTASAGISEADREEIHRYRERFQTDAIDELLPDEAFDDAITRWQAGEADQPEEDEEEDEGEVRRFRIPFKVSFGRRSDADPEAISERKGIMDVISPDYLSEAFWLAIGFALCLFGIILMLLSMTLAGILTTISGLLMIAGSVLRILRIMGSREEEPFTEETQRKLDISDMNEEDEEEESVPEQEPEDDVPEAERWDAQIRDIFARYGYTFGDDETLEHLNTVKFENREYRRLLQRRKSAGSNIAMQISQALEQQVRDFLSRYTDRKIAGNELEAVLEGIQLDKEKYDELSRRCENYEDVTHELRRQMRILTTSLRRYGFVKGEDPGTVLEQLRCSRITFDNQRQEYEKALQKVETLRTELEEKKGISLSQDLLSTEELGAGLKANSDRLLACQENLQNCRMRIEQQNERKRKAAETESSLQKLQAEIEETKHDYEVVRLTQEILAQAKENFDTRFMEPIMESFRKYYSILDKTGKETFLIDADSKVTVLGGGMPRDVGVLSQAYQDMVGLCIRMALLDAMYPAEKPVIVMDDPLVNLDDDRFQGGMEFLSEISGKYQVLYLTCHSCVGQTREKS